ncbi:MULTISPECIES: carbohydrate kinase family protein [Streptomyces]|uniref:carbohydrate kinase family protein n=1 Tax=Streptomyces TaxID=1883 RepID=UPI001873EF62|nr:MULTISPECIES: PfkB family carbohydrate kinase [Streptomyces]MCL6287032.1 PfkB family carbohydrate kinase [Streptomyces sp. 43Y-GA-1]MDX2672585.1 PfkB family carbohydrate kinase [Streptomyces sp. NRRL_ISP-5395]GHF73186.1 sugar kinase [Streptomyces griseus]
MSTETPGIDPLLALRAPRDPACDVFLTGTVFLDIVFTGLDSAPVRGTESWARGMGSSPGGVANMATALARLGLRTSLAAAFGDDHYGEYCWDALEQGEGIDLSMSHTVPGWHSPVTVSMAYEGERTMVSHGHEAPAPTGAPAAAGAPEPAGAARPAHGAPPASEPAAPGPAFPRCPPRARAAIASLAPGRAEPWVATAARDGALIFADVGWDETGRWDLDALPDLAHCEAFLPNAEEAMRYTRTDCPRAAAHALAERVPLAVVTLGAEGAYAVDGRTGAAAAVPAIEVEALDPTGAGDVFVAGFVTGTLADWPLADRLAFAGLTAALSVQEFGGSLSAPGWAEVAAWWQRIRTCAGQDPAALERYAFLDDLLPTTARAWPLRRAVPTIGFRQ